MINIECNDIGLSGSSPPMIDNSLFRCTGHVCKNSKADIVNGA